MVSLIVFSAMIYMLMIDYLRRVAKLDFVEWDIKTLSAGDYTAEYEISQPAWDYFNAEVYEKLPGCKRSKARELRKYMKDEFEQKLTDDCVEIGYDRIDQVKIAQITFAFNNAKIIHMLQKRGELI